MGDFEEPTSSHRCTTILYYGWKIFTCIFTHIMLVTMVVAYCILGAVTFESLESENEKFVKSNITYMRNNVTEDLWQFTKEMDVLIQDDWTKFALSRIKLFENDLVLAMKKAGWDGSEETDALQWTFAGALFYSIIVITTIGYGHIAPKTHLGKVTTIFYAIVGIPLMLLCLSNIGDIMAHSFRFLYWKVCCYACTKENRRGPPSRRRPTRQQGSVSNRNSSRSRTSSFRVSNRTSQRSMETGMAEGMTRSYSDTESRRDARYNRYSTRSEGSVPQRKLAMRGEDARSQQQYALSPVDDADPNPVGTPVLINKYAIESEGYSTDPRPPDAPMNSRKMGYFPSRQSTSSRPHTGSLPTERGRPGSLQSRQLSTIDDSYIYYEYSDDSSGTDTKPVPIWLCVFLVVSYIIGGAFLFSDWEDWGYADSAYFCFITLTTIGFGDFVPAQRVNRKNGEMSIALCSLYLLFGIALLAMSFNLVQEEVINNVKAVAKHLGIIKDDKEDSDLEYYD